LKLGGCNGAINITSKFNEIKTKPQHTHTIWKIRKEKKTHHMEFWRTIACSLQVDETWKTFYIILCSIICTICNLNISSWIDTSNRNSKLDLVTCIEDWNLWTCIVQDYHDLSMASFQNYNFIKKKWQCT
jgi:hypothetical protein